MKTNRSIIAGLIAFVIASSCCWLPTLIIALGGGTALLGFSEGLEAYSGLFIAAGILLLSFGLYHWFRKRSERRNIVMGSTITCPECGHEHEEQMPLNACQFFYECHNCKTILKPKKGDCCVFCSYGSMPCPPIQCDQDCC